eukprot:CAMPEP_0119106430 /NCGR_PEP_ID=MMETSP1180-20130426/4268_1 /TAXON_ID=3052 ORGANISM="Chlamydomonas cf sp, Strain CCMP681" /NCGR_SAMPLE_ID=MMETSP1180 /ASSEMBLY_ACC=CAM_ASM_000741 /LENGTH=165 /DNA_ID=CAMNT_0007091761 /DNA_START=23 /DNA_END=520 /DNA_ORIENTATION=+
MRVTSVKIPTVSRSRIALPQIKIRRASRSPVVLPGASASTGQGSSPLSKAEQAEAYHRLQQEQQAHHIDAPRETVCIPVHDTNMMNKELAHLIDQQQGPSHLAEHVVDHAAQQATARAWALNNQVPSKTAVTMGLTSVDDDDQLWAGPGKVVSEMAVYENADFSD